MEYFGTDLKSHGHYRWQIDGNIQNRGISFKDLPFNPEELTNNLVEGETVFYQGGGFTVFGIAGSCVDRRGGTKSIFWINEIVSKEEIINKIKQNNIAMQIINAMPFEIKW